MQLRRLDRPVVVAVVAVRMVQVAVDEVIDVVAIRDGFVAAAGAVNVLLVVAAAGMLGRARGRVAGVDREGVVVDMVAVHVVQVAVVQVVGVALVLHGGVAAARAMLVAVVVVFLALCRVTSCGTRRRPAFP